MEAPPSSGDPYAYVQPGQTNPGSFGVLVGWDLFIWYHGLVINQAWNDLQNIQGGQTVV